MTFKSASNSGLGVPNFYTADDVAQMSVGHMERGRDDTGLGSGEFIYLQATVAVAAGDAIVYQTVTPTAAKTASGTHANAGREVVIAMVALAANQYGWFQRRGVATVNALAAAAGGKVFISATAGSLSTGVIAGCQVNNACFESALNTPAAGKAYVRISESSIQTQIT